MTAEKTAQQIKEYALKLGFVKCGITNADNFDFVMEEIDRRKGYSLWKQEFEIGSKPKKLYKDAESIIVLAYDYYAYDFPEKLVPYVGRIYQSRSYLPLEGSKVFDILKQFGEYLNYLGINYRRDNNELLLRPAAQRAGVASFGKNNFAQVKGTGSFIVLFGFLIDRKLPPDEPANNNCPPGCAKCIDACPTRALYKPYKLNPEKCIGFCNWMRREDKLGKEGEVIPRDLRSKLGVHIHGCDLCQEVCPKNRKTLESEQPKDETLEKIAEKFTLKEIINLSEDYYNDYIYPIMYNYLDDLKYFRRNAIIAAGNTGDEQYIGELSEALKDNEEMIRAHAAWALGKINTRKSKSALINALNTETSQLVLEEIKDALEN